MDYEIIVNKENLISEEDMPKKLASVGINEHPSLLLEGETNEILLEEETAFYFSKMINDFNSCHENKIIPDSGFRSIEKQVKLLEYFVERDGEKAYSYVAQPRSSEHHTGLAIDVALIVDGEYTDDISGKEPEIVELTSKCHEYGFILRYPEGKEAITGYDYEPWHFRFVGLELAKVLYDSGLTLEEYKMKKTNAIGK